MDLRYDLSVDTLEAHRGKGLARMAAALLIHRLRQKGLEPIWGALDSNPASWKAGQALGFRPHGKAWLACR